LAGAAVLIAAALSQLATRRSFPWSWEPAFTVPLFALGFVLIIGLARLGVRTHYSKQWLRQSILLALGWLSLLIALNSPIHSLGEVLFWVHMIQHEVLLLITAPLFVLGNVLQILLAAFPRKIGASFGSLLRETEFHAAFRFFSRPLPAWCLGAAGLWVWHIPYLFDATLRSDAVHAAQHLTFLATSFFFWASLLDARGSHSSYGVSILYLFGTAIQTTFLGVLLTYSARPWYSPYNFTAPQLGYNALQDQQIGGLIMWVPAGAVFTVVALCLIPAWLRSSDARHALWAHSAIRVKHGGAPE
jgi:putative membrane protein